MILGLDLETEWSSPVNPKIIRPLEIGAVLYCEKTGKIMQVQSDLIYDEYHMESPPELVELTGITDDMRRSFGIKPKEALLKLHSLMSHAEFVVAHNGNFFDKIIYEEECERVGLAPMGLPWIDTKSDLPFPKHIKTTKLTHLCAEHGFVNPFAHRALFDVLSMLKIMSCYDFETVAKLAKQPTYKLVAMVSYNDRQSAKDRGYHWNGEEKKWTKHMKEEAAIREKDEAPFQVEMSLL